MRRSAELELRLIQWAAEFPNRKTEDLGYPKRSSISTLMTYHGPAPTGLNPRGVCERTPADEVEEAVAALERQRDGYRAAQVIRLEYRMKNAAVEEKLRLLRRIGLSMSRARFYDELWVARTHVAAWLRIPASVELPTEAA